MQRSLEIINMHINNNAYCYALVTVTLQCVQKSGPKKYLYNFTKICQFCLKF